MMRYIYAADVWCEPCGQDIMGRLIREGKIPAGASINVDPLRPRVVIDLDETAYDSDDFPKGPYGPEQCDAPEHCAAGEDCIAFTDWDGRRVGHFFRNPLTSEGYRDLRERLATMMCQPERAEMVSAYLDEYPDAAPESGDAIAMEGE